MKNTKIAVLYLALATACFGQGFIQTPPPYWYVVVPPGALATRPATCTANFHAFICNGAGCGTNGEYHYCTALNTWAVGSTDSTAIHAGSTLTGTGALLRDASAGTAGLSALVDNGAKITTSEPFSLGTKTTGASGVTANLLVTINAAGTVDNAAASSTGILGVAASSVATGLPVEVATRGVINCIADNTTVIGNLAIVGTGTGGRCRDSGQTSSTVISFGTQIVGKFLSVATVGVAASLQFYGPGHFGAKLSLPGAGAADDIGQGRNAAGIWEDNSGTAGKWASRKVGSIAMQSLATPTGLTVTPTCDGTCASTWTYTVVEYLADGTTATAAHTATSTLVNAATLDGTHYNTLAHTLSAGATSQTFYRSVSGGTPATVGKLATCTNITAASCVDNGLVGDTTVAPTVNSTGSLNVGTGGIQFNVDGVGDIGVGAGGTTNRPNYINSKKGFYIGSTTYLSDVGLAVSGTHSLAFYGNLKMYSRAVGALDFEGTTNSFPELSKGAINGFAIQSAAGTDTYNDAVTAGSGTVAQRHIFFINTPTMTATNASVTYTNTATLHVGIPTASTNVTFTNPAVSILADGIIKAAGGYQSADGTTGATVTTCTGYKNGLCISGT
jgi:hypothetical protein